jgi:hypothetical protein
MNIHPLFQFDAQEEVGAGFYYIDGGIIPGRSYRPFCAGKRDAAEIRALKSKSAREKGHSK